MLEAAQPILDRVARGQEHDWQFAGGTQLPRQLEPVAAGQHHVDHGQIGGRGENRIGVGVVGEAGDGDPFAPERPRDRLPDRLLVLDEHHSWRCAHRGSIAA